MTQKRRPEEERARQRGERERLVGIEADDEAARWLAEHDAAPPPAESKSLYKSKALHRWRQQRARDGR